MIAEDRQGEQASQYRTLLETSTDGFFINVCGRFHYVNPAFVRLLGARTEQLRQSQKLEALGTLAGGIAHDFNNILAVVGANAEIARARTAPDHPLRRFLDEILTASSRAKGVTHQVLAFSRRQSAVLRVIDLRATVAEELSLLRAAAPVGASIDEKLAPGLLPVRADATQIHQILLNLCTNAWQSFDGHPGKVTVRLRAVPRAELEGGGADLPGGAWAELMVRDDGPGMEATTRQRIFDPFFTTKGAHGGTGLGLSVVHGIVESHHGHLRCESALGRGAAFFVCFPLVSSTETVEAVEPSEAPAGQGQRLLVLDDDPAVLEAEAELLRSHGYRVRAFGAAAEALSALGAEPAGFDLLLTDLKMTEHTGLDVAEQARRLSPSLPVILVSGYLGADMAQRASALGIAEVLYKPVEAAALYRAVARALKQGP